MTEEFFNWSDPHEMLETVNQIEWEYQKVKLLPIQDDFSSGYAWGIFASERSQMVIGQFYDWDTYITECAKLPYFPLLTEEDLQDLHAEFDRIVAEGYQVGRYFAPDYPDGIITTVHRWQMLPLTKEQFDYCQEVKCDFDQIKQSDWCKALISTWSDQACAESGAENSPCPMCGSRAWSAMVIEARGWRASVAKHHGVYHITDDPNAGRDVQIAQLVCSICDYEQEPEKEIEVRIVEPGEIFK